MLSNAHAPAKATLEVPANDARRAGRGACSPGELRAMVAKVLGGAFRGARLELYLRDDGGELAPVDGGDPRGAPLLAALRTRLLETRHAFAEPYVLSAGRHGRSLLSAPLLADGDELRGLLVIEAAPGARDFTVSDLAVLEGVAALATMAAQRLPPTPAQRRRELDLTAARRVQRGLMSGTLPVDAGATAHTEYQPAMGVGGDFYSLKHLGDGLIGAAIGDVSGNGVSAALVMARVASDIERALVAGESPSVLLNALNGSLSGADAEMYVTAACLRLDTRSRRVSVANAGHLPLVVRRADGEVYACAGASGMPLGMFPGEYFEEEFLLDRRDILLLMTDGLLEALDHPSGHRGLQLLLGEIRGAPHDARLVSERIRAAVERSRRDHDLDDVTWVTLQLTA